MSFLFRIFRGHQSLFGFPGSTGNGLFLFAISLVHGWRWGTMYFFEDPAVAFSWIPRENPGWQAAKCSAYWGGGPRLHLGVFSLPPIDPAIG